MFAGPLAATDGVLSCSITPFPNTDMNEGNEVNNGPEPVVPGILDFCSFVGDSSVQIIDRCPQADVTAE